MNLNCRRLAQISSKHVGNFVTVQHILCVLLFW